MTGDRGSASVVAIAVLAVVVLVGAGLAAGTGLIADRAAARSAADLAALAGAHAERERLAGAGPDGCATAASAAEVNSARLLACERFGDGSVQVTVASGRGTASARAGPEK